MSDRQISPVTKLLLNGKAKIADKNHFCQGMLWNNDRYCARGALHVQWKDGVHSQKINEADQLLHQAALELYLSELPHSEVMETGFYERCKKDSFHVAVNNYIGHEAVLNVFDRAISLSMKKVGA